jgi:hypothetical protein
LIPNHFDRAIKVLGFLLGCDVRKLQRETIEHIMNWTKNSGIKDTENGNYVLKQAGSVVEYCNKIRGNG